MGIHPTYRASTRGTPTPITVDPSQGKVASRRPLIARHRWAFALVGDALLLLIASALAYVGRLHLSFFVAPSDVAGHARQVTGGFVLLWIVTLAALGGYRRTRLGYGTDEYATVVRSGLATASIVGIWCYLVQWQPSRGFFLLFILIGTLLLVLGRLVGRRMVQRLHSGGHLQTRVVVVGTSHSVDDVSQVLRREKWLGYDVVGGVLPPGSAAETTFGGVPVLGSTSDLTGILSDAGADTVIFAAGSFDRAIDLRRAAWDLHELGISMITAPALTDVSAGRIKIRPLAGLPLVFVDPPQHANAASMLKRSFDVAGALAVLVLSAPVLLASALWIKLNDGGPVLFRQTRVGRNGAEFSCLKFRSMVVNAEEVLQELRDRNEYDGVLFKMARDPRITAPGRLLRRLSLDEMPQLFNVLRGEMSLIGPRPPLPSEVERYHSDVHRRLTVRPGMTGLWQVSGRSDLSWDDTVRLDLYYVDNWSFIQDLSILVKTVRAVLGGKGAY